MSEQPSVGLDDRFDERFERDFVGERSRELEHALDRVTRAVSEVTRCAHLPSALRVRGGDLSVEIEWHNQAPVATVTETAPALAGAPVATLPTNGGAAARTDAEHTVTAPTVGVFYRAPEPGAAPFVEVGDEVTAGQQIGIVEVMKLMVPVEADRAGRVTAVLQENNTAVEYGTPLFRIAQEG
ncbi:acetyl-CoA carboxylase biotin carboxyl carrier protein [Gandjariella thermophila]|uniref:Biotin carboxyl carrier protein of acetyl-CoA carboxylase n=1 Tax=Gandjariella thermophila TaxID=1931992 RepID=A0A4D4J9S6_9PSEU|nr:biotin/lipoyl-containing protein [Gandjariella thermophila]GDY31750.1 hypothetical protein GTS_33830 [Gandjariella thermophila]